MHRADKQALGDTLVVIPQDTVNKSLGLASFFVLLCDACVIRNYVTFFPDCLSDTMGF